MSEKLSKFLFFFLFIFTPLAFGTTEPWSYAVMEIGIVLAVLFLLIHVIKHNQSIYKVPGIVPLCLFLLYCLIQLLPLPPAVVAWLSPETYKIHHTIDLLRDSNTWMTLTVYPKATLTEFFRYSSYVLYYILTVQLLKEKSTLQATAMTIALFGGLLALSSILQFYLTDDMALWFRHSPENSIVVGPYVNHNHYAGLMEMIFPIVLGLFLFYRPRIGNSSLFRGIAEMLSQEKANIHILIGAAAMLIITSIFVSLSRGAMISTFLSLIVFTFFLLKRRISKGNTLLIIGVIMLTALSIGWFGWDQIFERFARLKNAQGIIYESRLDFWKDTINIIKHYPVTGSGVGTFSSVYPLHRSIISEQFLTHAHNDYLELLAETGIIGFLLATCFILSFFYKTHAVFKKRRDAFSVYLYMGAITGIIAILIHSVTDFNLHIGANGLWFFFLAGIAVSAANTGIRKNRPKTRLAPYDMPGFKITFAGLVAGMAVCTIGFQLSSLVGSFYYSNIARYTMSAATPPNVLKKIDKVAGYASRFDPLKAEYVFVQANTAWFLKDKKRAEKKFKTALKLAPLNSRHLTRYAAFLAREKDKQKADLGFSKAMAYERSNPEYAFQYGAWLIATGQTEKGLETMKKTLMLDGKYIDRVLTTMIVNGIESGQIERAIPDTPGPSIAFSKFLFDTGDTLEAADRYIETLKMVDQLEPDPRKNIKGFENQIRAYYYQIFNFFNRHNDMKNAMQVMEHAEKKLPMDARIKVTIGDLYLKQGITYKAIEKYDHALLLDPGNKRALKMMEKINP